MKIPVTFLISFLSIILFVSCNKKDEELPVEELPPKGYMKTMIEPDTVNPYLGEYYIRADFTETSSAENNELFFTESTQNMTVWYHPSPPNLGMSSQGMVLSDHETHEKLIVQFYFNTESDTAFTLAYADYWYADPWRNVAGINIQYGVPVSGKPNNSYRYMGGNTKDSYCNITYIGDDRISGTFHCSWTGCCGGPGVYDVYGDFSIPMVDVIVYETN